MKERPILMSAPMVCPTLDDTKLHTRRAVKHPAIANLSFIVDCGDGWWGDEEGAVKARCPYGQPGDRLWVREAWSAPLSLDHVKPSELPRGCEIWHEATSTAREWRTTVGKRRPGMFMPRWASRITLEITSVRVQRLLDISEADALVEGIVATRGGFGLADGSHYHATDPRISYWSLWDAINGPGSAEANPQVWAVAFQRMKGTP